MNFSDTSRNDRIIRTAAWLYVLPRAAKSFLVVAAVGLAALMVFAALAINFLHRLGA